MFSRLFACGAALALAVTALPAGTPPKNVKEAPGMYAIFDTSMGRIVCQLFEKEAPKTVENFAGLAEGTKEFTDMKTGQKTKRRFYDGLIFHRVIPEFMIQGGCPLGVGTGGPGYRFEDEIVPSLTFDRPGRLAMANAGPGTNGSQFFITEVPTPWLNGHHTIFGQVVEGQDVVNRIARVNCGPGNKPVKDVVINKVTIERTNGGKQSSGGEQGALSGKKVLFVTAPSGYRDEEYSRPKEVLSAAGAQVVTASTVVGELKGMMGGTVKSDILLGAVRPEEYAAVVFVGGGGAQAFFKDPDALRVAKQFAAQGKTVGAICIAPTILANAGLLKGKTATAFASENKQITSCGANYTGAPVEQDGNIVTANGPEAADAFGQKLLSALSR